MQMKSDGERKYYSKSSDINIKDIPWNNRTIYKMLDKSW